jgi:gliding motility-associated-like protein
LISGLGSDDNGSFTINDDQLLSNATFDFSEKNIYTIRVSAEDEENLIERIFLIDITREPVTSVTYPSAFTPNGDGENDTWHIESIEYFPGALVTIYNRNGQKIFDSVGYLEPWDGTYNGNDLPVDSYHVVIKLNDELDTINGSVTILR